MKPANNLYTLVYKYIIFYRDSDMPIDFFL